MGLTLVVGACSPGASPGSGTPAAAPAASSTDDTQGDRTLYSLHGDLVRTVHVHHPASAKAGAPTTSVVGPVAQRSWSCAGHAVSVAVLAGGGHQYPGTAARTAGLDAPSPALDATTWLWTHLRASRTS